jgi:hypothetical protein
MREGAIMKMPKTPWPSINCLVLLLASPGEEIQSAVDSSPAGTTEIQ